MLPFWTIKYNDFPEDTGTQMCHKQKQNRRRISQTKKKLMFEQKIFDFSKDKKFRFPLAEEKNI